MPQVKISELSQASSVSNTDLFLISQDAGGGSFVSKAVPYSVLSNTGLYTRTFVNSDLAAGILTVTHNLNDQHALFIEIENNSGKKLGSPDDVTYVDANSLTIDFTSFGTITGTWYLRVSKGSGVAGGSSGSGDIGQSWALNA